MPAYFLSNLGVNGQAEMPDNNANQPLVRGNGPLSKRSINPPPPAMTVHTHAAIHPKVLSHLSGVLAFASWLVRGPSLIQCITNLLIG